MHLSISIPFILYCIPLFILCVLCVKPLRFALAPSVKNGVSHWSFSAGRLVLSLLMFIIPVAFDRYVPEVAGDMRWYIMHFFAFILLMFFFFGQAFKYNGKEKLSLAVPFSIAMALVIFILGIVTLIWSINLPMSLWFLKHLFAYIVFFGAFIYLRDDAWYRNLLWIVALGVGFNGLLGILQFLNITDQTIAHFIPFVDHVYFVDYFRQSAPPAGTLANKNLTGSYLVLTLPITLYLLFTAKRTARQVFAAVCFGLGTTLLVYTRSRGSWISALAAILFLGLWLCIHKVQRQALVKEFSRVNMALFAGALLFIVGFSQIPSRLDKKYYSVHNSVTEQAKTVFNMGQNDIGARYAYNVNGLAIIKENPFGTGLSTFHTIYPKYNQALIETPHYGYNISARPRRAHNDLLQAFIELGVLGGLAHIALFGSILVMGWRVARSAEVAPEHKVLTLAFVTGIAGFSLNALGDFPLQMPTAPFFLWSFMGIVTGVYLTHVKPRLWQFNIPSVVIHPTVCGAYLLLVFAGLIYTTYDNALRRQSTLYLKPAMSMSYAGVNNDYTYMHIQKAYALYPGNARTAELRAVITAAHGQQKPANIKVPLEVKVKALEDHLKYDPYAQNSLVNIAFKYMESAQNHIAQSQKETTTEGKNEHVRLAVRNIGYAHHYAERAAQVSSRDPHAYNVYGTTFLAQAKFKDALKWFDAALAIDPTFAPALRGRQGALNGLAR